MDRARRRGRAVRCKGGDLMPTRPPTLNERRRQRGALPSVPATAAAKFRGGRRWQKFRRWFRNGSPLCCDPFGDHERERRVAAATCVHHVVGLTIAPELGLDEDNCVALCMKCHAQVEQRERRGERTQQLFHGTEGGRGGVETWADPTEHRRPPESKNAAVLRRSPMPSNDLQTSRKISNDVHDSEGAFHG